ncbi:hypothetical protein BZA77DRAFT_309608 [Pyronema omphalodes]|nr:hypothetical protein BZA77DRAFT_309608 [Pyronema omphalodes]
MDMQSLSTNLPKQNRPDPELAQAFRTAAHSITLLYTKAGENAGKARQDGLKEGYARCLDDVLSLINTLEERKTPQTSRSETIRQWTLFKKRKLAAEPNIDKDLDDILSSGQREREIPTMEEDQPTPAPTTEHSPFQSESTPTQTTFPVQSISQPPAHYTFQPEIVQQAPLYNPFQTESTSEIFLPRTPTSNAFTQRHSTPELGSEADQTYSRSSTPSETIDSRNFNEGNMDSRIFHDGIMQQSIPPAFRNYVPQVKMLDSTKSGNNMKSSRNRRKKRRAEEDDCIDKKKSRYR